MQGSAKSRHHIAAAQMHRSGKQQRVERYLNAGSPDLTHLICPGRRNSRKLRKVLRLNTWLVSFRLEHRETSPPLACSKKDLCHNCVTNSCFSVTAHMRSLAKVQNPP